MKQFAILTVVFLFAFSVVEAQNQKTEKGKVQAANKEMKSQRVPLKKLEGTMVSDAAKKNFAMDFADAKDAQWKRSGTFDEVSFTSKDQKMTGFYDSGGKLVGTTQTVPFTKVPEKGQQVIKDKYKDYKIGPVIFFDDNEANETDMILWATQFDDEDLYFVELSKGASRMIVQVNPDGKVKMFKQL
jgi:hypothetical protein